MKGSTLGCGLWGRLYVYVSTCIGFRVLTYLFVEGLGFRNLRFKIHLSKFLRSFRKVPRTFSALRERSKKGDFRLIC